MTTRKFADGSSVPNSRAESAFVRSIDSCLTIIRSAERLSERLDHVAVSGSGSIRLLDDLSKP